MTSPPVPIQQAQGVDDRFLSALSPFVALLQQKQKRDMEQQELLVKKGWLQLQQEQHDAQMKAMREKATGMKEMGLKINEALTAGQDPEQDLKNLGALLGQAVSTGQTQTLKDAIDLATGEKIRGLEDQRTAKMSEYRTSIAKAQTAEEAQSIFEQAAFDFPQAAGAFSQMINARFGRRGGNIDPLSPEGIKAQVEKAKMLKAAGVTAQGRPPTEFEGKSAGAATAMLEAHVAMQRLESTNPGIGQSVDAKIRAAASASRAGSIGGAVEPFAIGAAIKGMTAEEQLYLDAVTTLVNSRVRRESGASVNLYEYDREGRPLIMNAGQSDDPRVLTAKQKRRLQAALIYAKQGGEAFDPTLLSEEARSLYDSTGRKGSRLPKAQGGERETPFDEDPWSNP